VVARQESQHCSRGRPEVAGARLTCDLLATAALTARRSYSGGCAELSSDLGLDRCNIGGRTCGAPWRGWHFSQHARRTGRQEEKTIRQTNGFVDVMCDHQSRQGPFFDQRHQLLAQTCRERIVEGAQPLLEKAEVRA